MPNHETGSSPTPEVRRKPTTGAKLAVLATRKSLEIAGRIVFGKDQLPAVVKGLCEDAILAPYLCSPDETESHLIYERAHTGQWISHDFRRTEFYPAAADKPWFKIHKDGVLMAMMPEGIAETDPNQRTDLPISEWLSVDNFFSIDKPGINKLLALGMVATRSHELAFEIAGQEQWIDELRSRGVAEDPVYQITPKAHSLVFLNEEGGKKTPKPKSKLQLANTPGTAPAW